MTQAEQLTFEKVDDFLLSLEVGHPDPEVLLRDVELNRLGPAAELLCANVPDRILGQAPLLRFLSARESRPRLSEQMRGLFHLKGRLKGTESWDAFCLNAQHAAQRAGFPKRIAQGFVAAILELEDNIHLHSQAPHTGFVAFRSVPGEFEFVVADTGVGILQSLRSCTQYEHVNDSGTALRLALTDGYSRFGTTSGHGYGFRPLFVGLANRRGSLRFRSSDHCLEMSGENPNLVSARIHQRPHIPGLQISVVCS